MPHRDREPEIRDKERRGRTREKEKVTRERRKGYLPQGVKDCIWVERRRVALRQMGVYKRETL